MSLSEKIANGIGIDETYVKIIATRNHLYAKYYIPKKNEKKRLILQPSKELKVIQRWLLKNILCHFPVSEYSFAYNRGDSVRKNAAVHRKGGYLLHTDITNFFPSISRKMLWNYFEANSSIVKRLNLTEEDIKLILDICLYRGQNLVVGSVASPRISNMIMYDFDLKLKKVLDEYGVFRYTRYADDLVISSRSFINPEIIEKIDQLMIEQGFRMNRKKTYYMGKNKKRQVTGVVLDNNQNVLSIGNKRYKEFQRVLYCYLVKGEGDLAYIKGYLSYIRGVSEKQYLQLLKIYSRYDKRGDIFEKVIEINNSEDKIIDAGGNICGT